MAETTNVVTSYSWSMTQGDAVQYNGPTSGLPYLMIAEDSLTAGIEYTFKLTANVNGVITSADATFTCNNSPSPGKAIVSPTTGIENETEFTMTATEWIDIEEDYPLTYAWKYYEAEGKIRDIQENLKSNTLKTKLIGTTD